jgi:hypothetical protein
VSDVRLIALHFSKMVTSSRMLLLISFIIAIGVQAQVDGNTFTPEYFESLERYWTYGRSPPVYPSRQSTC